MKAVTRYILQADSAIYDTAFSTITELQSSSFSGTIFMLGGKIIIASSILALLYFAYMAVIKRENKALLLVSFCMPLLVVSMFAGRFIFYFIPFFALLLGVAAGRFIEYAIPKIKEFFDFKNEALIEISILGGILAILSVSFLPVHESISKESVFSLPPMDDSIKEASQAMARNSSDAIILSWWDFGYMYEYYGMREVLFDGGNLGSKKLYWFSEAMLSSDTNRSANILRMLGCHAEGQIDRLIKQRGYESFRIIDSLLKSEKSAIDAAKRYNLSGGIVEKIYCDKEAYVVLSSDLREKYWAFVNFARPDLEDRFLKDQIKGLDFKGSIDELGRYFGDKAQDKYFDLMLEIQRKDHFSDPSSCRESEEGLLCRNGLMFSFNQSIAHDGKIQYSHTYFGKNYSRRKLEGQEVIFYYDKVPYAIIVDPDESESTFSKLYFGRKSDDNFELFYQIPESVSKGIVVYKLRIE